MTQPPMLADVALRTSTGLAGLLLATPWRTVPPAFFRTHCLVILGLLVVAALDENRISGRDALLMATITGAVLAYVGSIGWGLGLRRLGWPSTLLILLVLASALVGISWVGSPSVATLNATGRLASAALIGSTLTAMLLGHYYLTAPAMSIEPLKRFVRCMAAALGVRTVLAAVGLALLASSSGWASETGSSFGLFLAVRWGVGILGPLVATYLAWKTVQIRSTQSATGILYIAMTLVLFGELTALVLSRDVGIVL